MKRSLVVLALALALPAVLLAVGWIAASRSDRASKLDAASLRASRALAVAREAVSAGLESLREREDARPFYLYNHYYSPPEVLAVSDPVAVSPLAARPSDPRILGWFQIEPDGTVRTPGRVEAIAGPGAAEAESAAGEAERGAIAAASETADAERAAHSAAASATAGTERGERGAGVAAAAMTHAVNGTGLGDAAVVRLAQLARSEALDDLRAVVAASEAALVVHATRSADAVDVEVASAQGTPTRSRTGRPVRRASDADPVRVAEAAPFQQAPPQQVTVTLNTLDNRLADEIRRAQAGDVVAFESVTQRGRAAPITRREDTDLATIQTQQAALPPPTTRAASETTRPAVQGANATRAASDTTRPVRGTDATRAEREPSASNVDARSAAGTLGRETSAAAAGSSDREASTAAAGSRPRASETAAGSSDGVSTAAAGSRPRAASETAAASSERSARARATGLEGSPGAEVPGTSPVSLTPVEVDVQYTPMTWRDRGDTLALARVVSHEGAAVAQVVALDRTRVESWVDETIERATAGSDASVRRVDADEVCLHDAHPDAFPSGLRLCVLPSALDALRAQLDRESRLELLALLALLALTVFAVAASLRAIRREEELARARSEFVTAVSHELRTPLTTLRMHAEMLADDLVPEARRDKVHHELVRETQRLSRLVENVLETSRLEAGRRALVRVPLDVGARAREVLDGLAGLASSRGATLTLHASDDATFEVDADAFERVLVNLVDNALKYGLSEQGPREIEVTLDIGEALEVRVSDRGPGVPPADRERLFRRFARAPRADAEHRPGTGLGLSLVRELARAHGGDARIEAREGGGATVVVTFG